MTDALGRRSSFGDDVFCHKHRILKKGIDMGVANSILIQVETRSGPSHENF